MQISLCRPWATELEGEGDHRHERMAVKSLPGSPFEVVEPKLLFQLLMGLLANPTCLDGGSQSAQIGRSLATALLIQNRSHLPKAPIGGANLLSSNHLQTLHADTPSTESSTRVLSQTVSNMIHSLSDEP